MKKRITTIVLALFIVNIWATLAFGIETPWGNRSEKAKAKVTEQEKNKNQSESVDLTVRPNQPIKRLQTLVLFMQNQGMQEEVDNYVVTDEQTKLLKKIPDWGKPYVALALDKALLTVDEIKTFNPNQATKGYELELYKSRMNAMEGVVVENADDPMITNGDSAQVTEDEEQTSDQEESFFDNPMRAIKKFEIMSILNNLFSSVKDLLS
jgi:hypothetical protein